MLAGERVKILRESLDEDWSNESREMSTDGFIHIHY